MLLGDTDVKDVCCLMRDHLSTSAPPAAYPLSITSFRIGGQDSPLSVQERLGVRVQLARVVLLVVAVEPRLLGVDLEVVGDSPGGVALTGPGGQVGVGRGELVGPGGQGGGGGGQLRGPGSQVGDSVVALDGQGVHLGLESGIRAGGLEGRDLVPGLAQLALRLRVLVLDLELAECRCGHGQVSAADARGGERDAPDEAPALAVHGNHERSEPVGHLVVGLPLLGRDHLDGTHELGVGVGHGGFRPEHQGLVGHSLAHAGDEQVSGDGQQGDAVGVLDCVVAGEGFRGRGELGVRVPDALVELPGAGSDAIVGAEIIHDGVILLSWVGGLGWPLVGLLLRYR